MSHFTDWLNETLNQRSWNYSELARRAALSSGIISSVMNEQSRPGLGFCKGIAAALDIRPEVVLRRAELIPPLPPAVDDEGRLLNLYRRLPPYLRKVILAMLQGIMDKSASLPPLQPTDHPKTTYPIPDPDRVLGHIVRDPENSIRQMYNTLTEQLTPDQLRAAVNYLSALSQFTQTFDTEAMEHPNANTQRGTD